MTWNELTLKERSKLYRKARAMNPDLTYFDIRDAFNMQIPKDQNVQAYSTGGIVEEPVAATFGLPEVNIYPQNEFGDIARSQGVNTARNWRTVKEGTTKGINDFYNDPRTQIVMAGLPMPSLLDAAGDAIQIMAPIIKNTKVGKTILNTVDDITSYVDHKFVPKSKRFVQDTNTFTRGVGVGNAGLDDLVNSGIIRGNPRGGLASALDLAKIKKTSTFKNFEQLYPEEAMRVLNNDLREKDYELVSTYFKKNPVYGNSLAEPTSGISLRRKTVLDNFKETYPTYNDYLNKKTGYNKSYDFYETGDPRAFFFDDGANPGFTGTYPTKYFVKLNNPQAYDPFIPIGHQHYSTKNPISFYDPNVELYKNMKTFSGDIFGKKIKKPIK